MLPYNFQLKVHKLYRTILFSKSSNMLHKFYLEMLEPVMKCTLLCKLITIIN